MFRVNVYNAHKYNTQHYRLLREMGRIITTKL
jgi:hypothetical protein